MRNNRSWLVLILLAVTAAGLFAVFRIAHAQGCCQYAELDPPYDEITLTLEWYANPSSIAKVQVEPVSGEHLERNVIAARIRPGSEIAYGCPLNVYICPEYCEWDLGRPTNIGASASFTSTGPVWSEWVYWNIPTDTDQVDVSLISDSNCASSLSTVEMTVKLEGPAEPPPPPDDPTDPPPPPVDLVYFADQEVIQAGDCTTLIWEVQNADEVYWEGGLVEGYGDVQVCPDNTTSYTLEVLGADGNWHTRQVTVYVETPSAPEIDYWAADQYLEPGDCTSLGWVVQNAAEVRWEGEPVGPSGESEVCPDATSTYVLEVLGEDGEWRHRELTIVVEPLPAREVQIEYWSDDDRLSLGECTALNWRVEGAEEVLWEGQATVPYGEVEVCPRKSSEYVLEVQDESGNWHQRELRIPVASEPESPAEAECDPHDHNVIMVLTDTRRIAQRTGDDSAWERVWDRLSAYYESGAIDCDGMPHLVDIAETYPSGGYDSRQVEDLIQNTLQDWGFDSASRPLAALAIIGGPKVVPMPILPDPTGQEDGIYSDDAYANLNNDPLQLPDTVVTRLPDGGSADLMLNYIGSLESGDRPRLGSAILASLQTSAHRLRFRTDAALTGPNLDDILTARGGSLHYYLSPIWSIWGHQIGTVDPNLLRVDDFQNNAETILGESSIAELLSMREVLFHYLVPGAANEAWYARDLADDASLITAIDAQTAAQIQPGTHVFALLPGSADLISGDQASYNSIPLALLDGGAHHFIGSTGSLFFLGKNGQYYYGRPNAIVDIDLDAVSGALARYYYLTEASDPATSLFSAKLQYAREIGVAEPVNFKTVHSFIYYGLPERGSNPGAFVSVNTRPLPPGRDWPLQSLADCPSGAHNDCDGDDLEDSLEYKLAARFHPYLIFDEDENLFRGPHPFQAYWQVSPGELNDVQGAFITYVMAYPQDWGIHQIETPGLFSHGRCEFSPVLGVKKGCFDDAGEWIDGIGGFFKKLGKCAGYSVGGQVIPALLPAADLAGFLDNYGLLNLNVNQWLLGHAGDTEAFRIFLSRPNWDLTHIDWKRHHEGFGDEVPIGQAIQEGLQFYDGTHAILYVSEDKHATYPTEQMCESYPHEVFPGCQITFEHCAGWNGNQLYFPGLFPEHNVGEKDYQLMNDLSPIFQGEYVWALGGKFCGGIGSGGGLADEDCAGAMGTMWYHPIDNDPYR